MGSRPRQRCLMFGWPGERRAPIGGVNAVLWDAVSDWRMTRNLAGSGGGVAFGGLGHGIGEGAGAVAGAGDTKRCDIGH